MSFELGYSAPKGTKWEWGNKSLNYSYWYCGLMRQREIGIRSRPADVELIVDKKDSRWIWIVRVTNFKHEKREISGESKDGLKACLKAEKEGEKQIDKILEGWKRDALRAGWRPPS